MLSTMNVHAMSKQKKANHAYARALKKNQIKKFTNYGLYDITDTPAYYMDARSLCGLPGSGSASS